MATTQDARATLTAQPVKFVRRATVWPLLNASRQEIVLPDRSVKMVLVSLIPRFVSVMPIVPLGKRAPKDVVCLTTPQAVRATPIVGQDSNAATEPASTIQRPRMREPTLPAILHASPTQFATTARVSLPVAVKRALSVVSPKTVSLASVVPSSLHRTR